MPFTIDNGLRDVAAAAVLAVFIAVIAAIRGPRIKTLVFSIPIPFVIAYLAVEQPVDASYLVGIVLAMAYHWVVYALSAGLRLPVLASIPIAAAGYVATAATLRPLAEAPFFLALAAIVVAWSLVASRYRPTTEHAPPARAPAWIKAPLVFVIALVLYRLTDLIAGAVVTFPYAGVFTSFEMRRALRTLAGQFTLNGAAFLAMITTMHVAERLAGLAWPWPILPGVLIDLAVLGVIYRFGIGRPGDALPASALSERSKP